MSRAEARGMPRDFYDLLEVSEDAEEQEIREAYREKAREYHPDLNEDERADDQFKVIKQAHEVLTDPTERRAYDRLGHSEYVEKRLDGLPGMDDAGSEESPGETTDDTGSTRRDRRRRSYNRTGRNDSPSEFTPQVGVLVVLAFYAAGLWLFLGTPTAAVSAAGDALFRGDIRAAGTTLAGLGTHPFAFAAGAVADGSPAVLFPVGAALLPLAVAVAARRTGRRLLQVASFTALGPALTLAVDYAALSSAVALPAGVGAVHPFALGVLAPGLTVLCWVGVLLTLER